MAQRKTLTEAQIAVLRWIDDGCPDGVYEGVYHRISAASLVRRDLASTTGRGPTWAATITDAGREYLAQVDGSTPPIPRQANRPVAEQLIDQVIAAGGTLAVPRSGRVDWQQRVRQAIRHNKVPPGKKLEYHSDWRSDTREIRLVDVPEDLTPVLVPVPVPEKVARYHPMVQAVRNDPSRLEISNAALPRASRILHGLVLEAERRGYEISIPAGHRNRNHQHEWSSGTDGHLLLTIGDHSEAIRIHEEGLRVKTVYKRPPWDGTDPLDYRHRGTYRQVRDDKDATGRLTIAIVTGHSDRASSWSDRKRWTLDDKLPDVLAEIAVRAAEARHAQAEAERKAAVRKVAWEAAMVDAKELHHQARCARELDAQLERWERATRIRAYCDHLDTTHPENIETQEWISWARAHADELDPATTPPVASARLEKIPAEELRPYLRGFSPYGPEAHH